MHTGIARNGPNSPETAETACFGFPSQVSRVRARRPLESAQLRPRVLERDEFADGRLARASLETHDEPDLERLRQPLQCCDTRPVLT